MSEPDEGIYDAMNKGIDLATGEWINFMNSGDWFYETGILRKIFEKNDIAADIVYGDVFYVYGLGAFLRKAEPLNLIVKQMVFCHQATFVRLTLMEEMKFDTAFKSSGDYNFFYQCYKLHKSFQYVPFIIAAYEAEYGISRNYALVKYEDAYIHGINHSLYWKVKYFFSCLLYNSKQIIKRVIPLGIVKKIKDHNIKRLVKAE
jgi:glycosyltransferase involved in cell wall biosynthesis